MAKLYFSQRWTLSEFTSLFKSTFPLIISCPPKTEVKHLNIDLHLFCFFLSNMAEQPSFGIKAAAELLPGSHSAKFIQ